METITAYKCSICGGLHKTKRSAQVCERKCIKQQEDVSKKAAAAKNLKDLHDYVRLNASSPEEICKLMVEVSKKMDPKCYIEKVDLRVSYSPIASNSHSAPIGQMPNWCGIDKTLPRGGHALVGNITIHYNRFPGGGLDHNPHQKINGINTGTGGSRSGGSRSGGVYVLGYDVTLWLDDFPKIKDRVESITKSYSEHNDLREKIYAEYRVAVDTDPKVIELKDNNKELNRKIAEIQSLVNTNNQKFREMCDQHKEPFKVILDKHCDSLEVVSFMTQPSKNFYPGL